jgi:hypothetical protein
MTDLIKFEQKYKKLDSVDLCEALKYLCNYGNPRVSRINGGWCSSMDMFVSGKGVEFEIKSEFNHKTPEKAVEQVIERMVDALKKLAN